MTINTDLVLAGTRQTDIMGQPHRESPSSTSFWLFVGTYIVTIGTFLSWAQGDSTHKLNYQQCIEFATGCMFSFTILGAVYYLRKITLEATAQICTQLEGVTSQMRRATEQLATLDAHISRITDLTQLLVPSSNQQTTEESPSTSEPRQSRSHSTPHVARPTDLSLSPRGTNPAHRPPLTPFIDTLRTAYDAFRTLVGPFQENPMIYTLTTSILPIALHFTRETLTEAAQVMPLEPPAATHSKENEKDDLLSSLSTLSNLSQFLSTLSESPATEPLPLTRGQSLSIELNKEEEKEFP